MKMLSMYVKQLEFIRIVPVVMLLWLLGCGLNDEQHALNSQRQIGADVIVLQMPGKFTVQDRPSVEFQHGKHVKALNQNDCGVCHEKNEDGVMGTQFARPSDPGTRGELIDLYHLKCIGCHTDTLQKGNQSGPVTCGECHVKRSPAQSLRMSMGFNTSLHQRHSMAMDDECDACHHLYNENTKKLEYVKEKEEACHGCHGAVDDGKKPSLEHASHTACIQCHQERIANKQKTGPIECSGCHDSARQAAVEQLQEIPRLKRGQPDTAWIFSDQATAPAVPFNHQLHEAAADNCSTCHHKTLKSCKECHTLQGDEKGGGVTLEQAYHGQLGQLGQQGQQGQQGQHGQGAVANRHSCVGCHQQATRDKDCAGCHQFISGLPKQQSCVVCHKGPAPKKITPKTPAPVWTSSSINPYELPAYSEDFPEKLTIKGLEKEYKASEFPHGKIVNKMMSQLKDSKLAARFHGNVQSLCAGCHHRGLEGTRPSACGSCHSSKAHPVTDKPNLLQAYHRQCIGCHEKIGNKHVGCTDCHEKKEKGVQP